MKLFSIVLVSISVAILGCGLFQTGPAEAQEERKEAAAEPGKKDPGKGKEMSAEAKKKVLMDPKSAEMNEKAPDVFKVKFETSKGDIIIEIKRELSPLGVDRFYNLVRFGYYDEARFFRVISGFMAQFGINADPEISAKWINAGIKDEPVKASNTRGMVTFAKRGTPNSRTIMLPWIARALHRSAR
jgi:hypothetical protein